MVEQKQLAVIIGNMLTKIIKQPDFDWAVIFIQKDLSKIVEFCLVLPFTKFDKYAII